MKIKPLNDRILVKRLEAEDKSKGGIIIPDTAKERPNQGRVIAVGDGAKDKEGKRMPVQIKVGERILFSSYAGTELKLEGDEFVILREDDVYGVIE
ncbi:MAG: co-chaperone GroES [Candidatus Latescibacterota bacterium]|nr:MAG: co-chaperone GroES [Candidatus Latescibacterota bacterium]